MYPRIPDPPPKQISFVPMHRDESQVAAVCSVPFLFRRLDSPCDSFPRNDYNGISVHICIRDFSRELVLSLLPVPFLVPGSPQYA